MSDFLLAQPEAPEEIHPAPQDLNSQKRKVEVRRLLGLLFVFVSVMGMVFSLFGLIQIWRYRPLAIQAVNDNLDLFAKALTTTEDGLAIADKTMQTLTVDVASLQATTQSLALAIHDTNPMLDSISDLAGRDLPAAIGATQTSLASAQGSAQLIDNTLALLTSIPFSPVSAYKPDVPLHTALAQVSQSLDTLPPSLITIRASLANGKANLGEVESELKKIAKTTQGISTSLDNAKTVIGRYQAIATQLKTRVEAARQSAPAWITALAWMFSFVLVWLIVSQLGLAMQGWDMWRDRR